MSRLIANSIIDENGITFQPGDELPISNTDQVKNWLDIGFAVWETGINSAEKEKEVKDKENAKAVAEAEKGAKDKENAKAVAEAEKEAKAKENAKAVAEAEKKAKAEEKVKTAAPAAANQIKGRNNNKKRTAQK